MNCCDTLNGGSPAPEGLQCEEVLGPIAGDNGAYLTARIAAMSAVGGGTICLAAGTYGCTTTIAFAPNVIVKGTGNATILSFTTPGMTAVDFANVFERSELRDLVMLGIAAGALSQTTGIGINLDSSQRVLLRNVQVWDFGIGILISSGGVFSAYHEIDYCEVNRCAIGMRAYANCNGVYVNACRIFFCHTAADAGIGLDLQDCIIEIPNITVEPADRCVRVRNTNALTQIAGGTWYLEPGTNPVTATIGLIADVVLGNLSDGIEVFDVDNIISSGARTEVDLPPEGFVHTNVPSRMFFGARYDGAAVPKYNLVRNGDLREWNLPNFLDNWGAAGPAPTLAEFTASVYTGVRSMLATSGGIGSTVSVGFTVSDPHVEWVTCGVAYKVGPGNVDFFAALNGGVGAKQLSDAVPGIDLTNDPWRVRWIQAPVGGTRLGAVSFNVGTPGTDILIGAAWVVPGRYAIPENRYDMRYLFPTAPITFHTQVVNGNVVWGPIDITNLPALLAPPLDKFSAAPIGVVGAKIRLRIETDSGVAGAPLAAQHWIYMDIPAAGTAVAADVVRLVSSYSQLREEQDFDVRDTTISGGYVAGDAFTSDIEAQLVAWILG